MKKPYLLAAVTFLLAVSAHAAPRKTPAPAVSSNEPILLDTVVATVDEKPITLRELGQRLSPPRRLTVEAAAHDQEALAMLDRMIFEQTILAEADTKKLSVDDNEINHYMEEVAKKNNLTNDGLLHTLQEQGKDLAEYRHEIKIDILRSRLGANYVQSSSAVTSDEINAYLDSHPELKEAGSQVKISRIVISTTSRSQDEAKARAEDALQKIKSGEKFSDVARTMSDGAESKDGGSLGLLAEKDLSEDIFNAVSKLNKGEVSDVLPSPAGFQILKLEDRMSSGDTNNQALMADVKQRLQEDKSQNKIQSFFTSELYKNHTIEKKI